jgi:nucleoid-associated protein YgaU
MPNEIQQPKPFDLVGDPVLISGIGQGFEATLNWRVQLDRLFVEVFEESAQDGSEINKVIVPVIYGPRIVQNYIGFRTHVVKPGDTLSKISEEHYGSASQFQRIVRANPLVIDNPNLIFAGQQLKVPIGS